MILFFVFFFFSSKSESNEAMLAASRAEKHTLIADYS